jgi:NADH-quinone oxidoreductase subunit J
MSQLLFYALSILAVFCSLMMVYQRNPMYSVLNLLVAFFAIAGLYLMLDAQFLAIVHIIVYAGAIMVLFIYVIMFLNLSGPISSINSNVVKMMAAGTGLMFLFVLLASLIKSSFVSQSATNAQYTQIGDATTLGKVLFNEFLIPFELTSALFLSAMIGVVIFNKKEIKEQ